MEHSLSPALAARIAAHATALARRQTGQSRRVAKETAEILRMATGELRFSSGSSLINSLSSIGKRLSHAQPLEFEVGNIVRRVLFIAREEVAKLGSGRNVDVDSDTSLDSDSVDLSIREDDGGVGVSAVSDAVAMARSARAAGVHPLQAMKHSRSSLTMSRSMAIDSASVVEEETSAMERQLSPAEAVRLKQEVLASILELIEELTGILRNIAEQGPDHIHANEIIMTCGSSRTVTEFLRTAKRKGRSFSVIVAESAPSLRGRQTASALTAHGIPCTLIPDSAVFAVMSRVNKVIIGTHGVMANGSLVALSGAHALALAAKHYEVPLLCVCGLYKLTPLYPQDIDTFNDLLSPTAILPFEEVDALEHVHVQNPAYDHVPPELVSLYITNFGGHSPSYVYRLLFDFYSVEDTLA